jgi:hypothetical protein
MTRWLNRFVPALSAIVALVHANLSWRLADALKLTPFRV